MSDVSTRGSTYQTQDEGYALTSEDSWFRPVDIQTGPDGGLYVADFYEQRIDHASHYQGRVDRDSGRIYRLVPEDSTFASKPYSFETPEAMVASLQHPNRWVRQTAVNLIHDEPTRVDIGALRSQWESDSDFAVDMFWGLYAADALQERDWLAALRHPNVDVRRWAVRLIGDSQELQSPELLDALVAVTITEPDVRVRSQVASTAARLPIAINLRLIRGLSRHAADADDPYVPLLAWWAVERACSQAPDAVVELAGDPSFASSDLADRFLLERIMRRFTAPGDRRSLVVAARLLESSPSDQAAARLLQGFDTAMQGRSLAAIPDELARQLLERRPDSLELKVMLGQADALVNARSAVVDPGVSLETRIGLARVLASRGDQTELETWFQLLAADIPEPLRTAALAALMDLDDPNIAERVLSTWDYLSGDERLVAQTTLASREPWAKQLLDAVDTGRIVADAITPDTARRMLYHQDPRLTERIEALWPSVGTVAEVEDEAQIAAFTQRIVEGNGNPYDGRALFTEHCAKCHKLFGAGGDLGPELTSYQRTDLRRLLSNVLTPSLEIREGFVTQVVETDDGLLLTGFLESQDEAQLVLRQADGRAVAIAQDAVVDRFDSPQSLMPSGLLATLDDQQLRDLFAYLRSAQPLP
ncbi:MAG: HEAT repeat domain-containing protein [Pirellulaceae bacterium]